MAVLVDTSALYALADRADHAHRRVRAALRREREAVVVPQAVLPGDLPPAERARRAHGGTGISRESGRVGLGARAAYRC